MKEKRTTSIAEMFLVGTLSALGVAILIVAIVLSYAVMWCVN